MKKIEFDPRILKDYYLADYFIKTKTILLSEKPQQILTMQWFQRQNNVTLAGIEYVLELLKFACPDYDSLKIEALDDGTTIDALEPVLKITGSYANFAFLEGMIDGILARATSVATNSKRILAVANQKTVLNMNDRADAFTNQQLDGYASYIGGIRNFVTLSALEFLEDSSVPIPQGTMPHALIAAFGGDTIRAAEAFAKIYPNNNLVILIDYHNDCVNEAIKAVRHFKKQLYAVRIDTSDALIDESLKVLGDKQELHGVNPTLVKKVRAALDENEGAHVKIIVSSGFDAKKIAWFEAEGAPVDVYGVGEAITKEHINFTGDAVLIDGKNEAKVGRKNIASKRLKRIK